MYARELSLKVEKYAINLSFGDYVEAFDPKATSSSITDNRTEPCIALHPAANMSGS